jgi:ABC-type nitrate/sulfonate/bicarbonate transport system substrate-binding protein
MLSVLLMLAACGGGDSPASQATPAAGAATATPRPLTKVIFQAGFKAQADLPFVAAYVAKDNGYFAQEGLDVEIQHSSGSDNHLKLLAAERIQFATAPASQVLQQRATSGVPLESVALWGQRGDTVFAVLDDSGINSPKDFEGKTVGYKGSPLPEYLGMLKAAGVDRSKIKEVAVGFDARILVEHKVDVLPVFRSNEPDTIRGLGARIKTFDPADFGVPSLGVTYAVNSDWADKNADTVTAFLRATMRATAWIGEHRDQAIDITLRYAPGEQRAHQRFMLDTEWDAAQSDLTKQNGIGWMDQRQWQAMADALLEYKAIDKPTDVSKAFTTRFLAPVYHDGKLVSGP